MGSYERFCALCLLWLLLAWLPIALGFQKGGAVGRWARVRESAGGKWAAEGGAWSRDSGGTPAERFDIGSPRSDMGRQKQGTCKAMRTTMACVRYARPPERPARVT